MKVYNDPISRSKMRQFNEILCATGGRYIGNPVYCNRLGEFRVSYIPGDYKELVKRMRIITTGIKEIRKDQLWRRLIRRIVIVMKINSFCSTALGRNLANGRV